MRLRSPYDGEWMFGRLPDPTPGTHLAVVVPGVFIGTVVQSDNDPTRWSGGDIKSQLVICERGWWCWTDHLGKWTDWDELNAWWQVL
jgi:hypothetical protein